MIKNLISLFKIFKSFIITQKKIGIKYNEIIDELNKYILSKLGNTAKIFVISALNGSGCKELMYAIYDWLSKPDEIK